MWCHYPHPTWPCRKIHHVDFHIYKPPFHHTSDFPSGISPFLSADFPSQLQVMVPVGFLHGFLDFSMISPWIFDEFLHFSWGFPMFSHLTETQVLSVASVPRQAPNHDLFVETMERSTIL